MEGDLWRRGEGFWRGGIMGWTGKGREILEGERGKEFGSENEEVLG